jgi:hypothetical protein
MNEEQTRLLERIDRLVGEVGDLREGIRRAVIIVETDPEMSLIRVRKVLEQIVRDIFEKGIEEDAGTRPLENLLQRIIKDKLLPRHLAPYANGIRDLGNFGAHGTHDVITSEDLFRSLNMLLPILEWYFTSQRAGNPAAASGHRDESLRLAREAEEKRRVAEEAERARREEEQDRAERERLAQEREERERAERKRLAREKEERERQKAEERGEAEAEERRRRTVPGADGMPISRSHHAGPSTAFRIIGILLMLNIVVPPGLNSVARQGTVGFAFIGGVFAHRLQLGFADILLFVAILNFAVGLAAFFRWGHPKWRILTCCGLGVAFYTWLVWVGGMRISYSFASTDNLLIMISSAVYLIVYLTYLVLLWHWANSSRE